MTWIGLGILTALSFGAPSQEYVKSVESWRRQREIRLRAPDGYLALVALSWLKEGENSIGSDPKAAVRLPRDFPAWVGNYVVSGQEVTLVPGAGIDFLVDQKKVQGPTRIEWRGEHPSEIALGRIRLSVAPRNRGVGPRARVRDPEAESLRKFRGVKWYPVNDQLRVLARFEKLTTPEPTVVPNSIGTENDIVLVGHLTFQLQGKEIKLKAHEGEDGGLFVIFRDASNGVTTYAAGRYLATEKPQPDGTVFVDFNLAYSPPCAFNRFTTCPYIPENKIPMAVEGGERYRPSDR